jgi:beta-lactamase regulating signal transducer with metallopeptidase domain
MTYYFLAAALCLAVLFIVMTSTFVACTLISRVLTPWLRSRTMRSKANFVFAALISPLVLACLAAFGLVLPAFLIFEPRSTGEIMNGRLLGLALAGGAIGMVMLARAVRAWRATARIERQWRAVSHELRVEGCQAPVHRVDGDFPFVIVAGLLRPRIFIGRSIMGTLSADELSAALAHENAHVESFDNFKQLLLKITRPPSWLGRFSINETTWASASEVAADEQTLTSGISALDLSAALIKVGRFRRQMTAGDQLVASHFLSAEAASSLEVRVTNLEHWLEAEPQRKADKPRHRRLVLVLAILVPALAYAVSLPSFLPAIHEALELLVR